MHIGYMENGKLALIFLVNQQMTRSEFVKFGMALVPENIPFYFLDDSDLLRDQTFRDAWEIDETMREPDGYGSQYHTFEELEEEKDVEDQSTESD